VALSANGLLGELQVMPASLTFSPTVKGATSTQTLQLKNIGGASLRVASLSIASAQTGAAAMFSAGSTCTGLDLAAGASCAFTVAYAPTVAGTQAAKVAQWELEQSIANPFHGAKDGLRGMADLGLSIDPVTKRATVDNARLDAALTNGKSAAMGALREFTDHFAKAAELLNSAGNFINNRLDNLSRVIGYIDTNLASLQAEFGLGDPATPTAQQAKALAGYNASHGKG